MNLYPFKFHTIFKEKIWGGEKIRTILQKDFSPAKNCGETWEISGVKGNISVIANGPLKGKNLKEVIREYQAALVGEKVYQQYHDDFPLLVKFLDAKQDLSIQVHPDDSLAQTRHQSLGKTEMWYIIQADQDATLISGFNRHLDQASYMEHLKQHTLDDILNREVAKADDVFYLPAGRVHTIGAGLLLAEIQQCSDITYRIYDFDRVDDEGNKRELHTEEALDAIDYAHHDDYKTNYQPKKNQAVTLVKSPYFTTNMLHLDQEFNRNYNMDSFVIYVCILGMATLTYIGGELSIKMGDCLLIPASLTEIFIQPKGECKILESHP